MIHRLKDEAIAIAAEENIPVADAIEYVTGDVDLRKQIRVLLTWTPAKEAAKAERGHRWTEFATIGAKEWRAAYAPWSRPGSQRQTYRSANNWACWSRICGAGADFAGRIF